jgi:hypothetical protein
MGVDSGKNGSGTVLIRAGREYGIVLFYVVVQRLIICARCRQIAHQYDLSDEAVVGIAA